MPTTLPERRKPSKIVVWARDSEIAVLLAAFWFMTRHSPERRKAFREALTSVQNERRRRRSRLALDGMS
jgi:hypothetical protein